MMAKPVRSARSNDEQQRDRYNRGAEQRNLSENTPERFVQGDAHDRSFIFPL